MAKTQLKYISFFSAMLARRLAAVSATVIFAFPSFADDGEIYAKIIAGLNGCVASAQDLERSFKDRVQNHCFQVAFELCSAKDSPTECLLENISAIDQTASDIIDRLPKAVNASVFQNSYYSRTLVAVSKYPDRVSCSSSDEHELAICKMREASLRLIDAFNLAEIAEIQE